MIRIIIILLCLTPSALLSQVGRFNYPSNANTETWSVVATDNFEAHALGDMDGEGNWVQIYGRIDIEDNGGDKVAKPEFSSDYSYYYYNTSLGNDQAAEAVLDAVVQFRNVGVFVRGSTTQETCYYYFGDTDDSTLGLVQNGVNNALATGDAFSTNDVIRLEVVGNELRCYKNGSLDTSISGDGKYEDNTLTSGYGGLYTFGNGVSYIDLFQLEDQ